MTRRPPGSTLFPSTPLSRSRCDPDTRLDGRLLAATRLHFALEVEDDPRVGRRLEVELRSEEHTSELQSRQYLVCRLLLEKKTRRIAFLLYILVDRAITSLFK